MNKAETLKILSVIKAAYPNFGSGDINAITNLWNQIFEDIPYSVVNAATLAFISSEIKGFPPSPGQINSLCHKMIDNENITESEAVTLILRATKNGIYGAEEEFKNLPPICQRIVVTPERLTDWAKLSEDEVNTVIASNLRRAYISQVKKDEEIKVIPNGIREQLENWKLLS